MLGSCCVSNKVKDVPRALLQRRLEIAPGLAFNPGQFDQSPTPQILDGLLKAAFFTRYVERELV